MRCRPDDLAVIVSSAPAHAGWLVRVLYASPRQDFKLPDGYLHHGSAADWVIESLCGQFAAPVSYAGWVGTRLTRFVCVEDKWLRPIRDDDGADETLTWAGKPDESVLDVVRALSTEDAP